MLAQFALYGFYFFLAQFALVLFQFYFLLAQFLLAFYQLKILVTQLSDRIIPPRLNKYLRSWSFR